MSSALFFASRAISQYQYDEYVKAADAKAKAAEDIKYTLDGMLRSNRLGLDILKYR